MSHKLPPQRQKALKMLLDAYWDPKRGWKSGETDEISFAFAKEQGFMFDDQDMSHDQLINATRDIISRTTKHRVVSEFIASLTSRRLDLRSALASYACGLNLPAHPFTQSEHQASCALCQEPNNSSISLSALNFERHKFGGVRHLQPAYIWLDLTLLEKEPPSTPNPESVAILKEILDQLRALSAGKLSDAQKSFQKTLKANKDEREAILSLFGYLGILQVRDDWVFHRLYVPYFQRGHSNYSKSDWPFPADLWLPAMGLNEAHINFWFGAFL